VGAARAGARAGAETEAEAGSPTLGRADGQGADATRSWVNSALQDSCGGRHVRVRGHAKVARHLFFGVLDLMVHKLMRPVA